MKKIFLSVQNESLFGAAREIRAGVDEVDKSIPMTTCGCQYDYCGEIARIIAGEGNTPTLRINNGNYTPVGARYLFDVLYRAALPRALEYNRGISILAETDTCPQNRYSTGANSLHSHFTLSILAGLDGAKHWLTRLSSYEPQSGKAYRRILSKYTGFYEYLSCLAKTTEWSGCRIPLPKTMEIDLSTPSDKVYDTVNSNGWGLCVLERLGLPLFCSARDGGAVFLDNGGDASFSDEEIKKWLDGTLILSSGAAESLIKRGFGERIGVRVGGSPNENPSGETIHANLNRVNIQQKLRVLEITNENAYADSTVYHLEGGSKKRPMFPGGVVFRNTGGTVVTFCGTPTANFNYMEAFSFLNESRKLQLINLLKSTGNLPVYYPDDAELMLMAGMSSEGELVTAIFNIGFDPIEELPLVFEKTPKSIKILTPDGEKQEVVFKCDGERTVLRITAETLTPVILFVR